MPKPKAKKKVPEVIGSENEEILKLQIKDLIAREDTYVKDIEVLHFKSRDRERDTTRMVKYLEAEVKKKDDDNKELAKQIKEISMKQHGDKTAMRLNFEESLKEAEQRFLKSEADLLESNRELMQEVSDLSQFKKMQKELAAELEATKHSIAINEERHQKQLEELAKKFYDARDRLEKEADARIAHSRQVYKEEVGKELDMDSKRIRRENRDMEKELKFQAETCTFLAAECLQLREKIASLRDVLKQITSKDDECALKGLRYQRQIKEAEENIRNLEKCLNQVIGEDRSEMEALSQSHQKQLAALHKEDMDVRQAHALKQRELQGIKRHARNILMQRNQLEQDFIALLEQVKEEVVVRRDTEYKQQVALHTKAVRAMAVADAQGQYSSTILPPPPKPPKRSVTLSDMNQGDRNRVLRLLIAHIKASPAACAHVGPPFVWDSRQDTPLLHSASYDMDLMAHSAEPSHHTRSLTFVTNTS